MIHPTREQLAKAAVAMAEAERTMVENKVLKTGLRLTNDEMKQAAALAELAIKSGVPDRFLNAVASVVYRPIVAPCSCWWCRLRRWWRKARGREE